MKIEKRELKDLTLLDRFLFAEAVEDQETMEIIRKLQDKIDEIRSNEEIGEKYMNYWEEVELERQEAYDEGVRDTALKMKEDNVPLETISKYTGLSKEEIEKL